jgi:hypothetical protein
MPLALKFLLRMLAINVAGLMQVNLIYPLPHIVISLQLQSPSVQPTNTELARKTWSLLAPQSSPQITWRQSKSRIEPRKAFEFIRIRSELLLPCFRTPSLAVMSMDWIGYENRFKSNPNIGSSLLTGYLNRINQIIQNPNRFYIFRLLSRVWV